MTTAQLIRAIAKNRNVTTKACSVLQVNQSERTCDCRPLNGDADILAVRLQTDPKASTGICAFPTVGSHVLVTFIIKNDAFVSLLSDVDSYEIVNGGTSFKMDGSIITMNAGNNGGLINIVTLVKDLNNLINAFNSHVHVQLGAVATPVPNLIPVVPIVQGNIEDTNIKH